MIQQIAELPPRTLARIAGGLYLIVIISGFFAEGLVPSMIIVAGNPASTLQNILSHDLLYRSSIAVHLIALVCNIPLAVIFYELFKIVNRRISLLVVFFTLVGTAVEAVALLYQFQPLILLGNSQYSSAFTPSQLQVLVSMPLDLQTAGFDVTLVFFGFYCLSLGYLLFRSTFLPRVLGVLLAVGGGCYLFNSFATFLDPAFAAYLFPYIQLPSLIGEGSFCIVMFVKG
ncbi:MAG: DUF4386 domain-containing protein, partial [Nitrososphaerales archaeon]